MFRVRKPDEKFLERIRDRYRDAPLSYSEVGCSDADGTPGYAVDTYRTRLGAGPIVYERARAAFAEWRMLRLGWVEPCWPDAAIATGTLIGTMARLFGLWTVNMCRIVRTTDEDGPVASFGLAYGTLVGHAETGEERFRVEWDHADDSVWYEIRAVSKPGSWLTRLGYPLTRRLQRRFGRDSMRAMTECVERPRD